MKQNIRRISRYSRQGGPRKLNKASHSLQKGKVACPLKCLQWLHNSVYTWLYCGPSSDPDCSVCAVCVFVQASLHHPGHFSLFPIWWPSITFLQLLDELLDKLLSSGRVPWPAAQLRPQLDSKKSWNTYPISSVTSPSDVVSSHIISACLSNLAEWARRTNKASSSAGWHSFFRSACFLFTALARCSLAGFSELHVCRVILPHMGGFCMTVT